MKNILKNKKVSNIVGPLIALIVLSLLLTIITDQFFKTNNLLNILRQASINALVSFGMLFVFHPGYYRSGCSFYIPE